MKNRIRFNNIVVTADELPKIEQIVRMLSNLSPSDAFISIDFFREKNEFHGTILVSSAMRNFEESANHRSLVPLMQELSTLIMIHIELWKKHRFDINPEIEKIVS